MIRDFEKITFEFEMLSPLTDDERQFVGYVNDRHRSMETKRKEIEREWDIAELHTKAEVPASFDGKANVNMPLEQNLLELYCGSSQSTIQYKVEPVKRCDPSMLEIAKAVIDHTLTKENAHKELKRHKYNKGKYGTGLLRSGVWFDSKVINKNISEFYSQGESYEIKDIRHIGIKDLNIRNVYFDERALTSDEAMDCIVVENMGIEEFRMRFGNRKGFKYVDSVQGGQNNAQNISGKLESKRNVTLWHYFNKTTGRYAIFANKFIPIFIGTKTDKHGKLPVVAVQHYPRTDCLYGIGIPMKLLSVKPYINNMLKLALDSTRASSAAIIATSNNDTVDGEYFIDPSSINVRQFQGDLDSSKLQQLRFDNNVSQLVQILQLMEDYGIQNTGLNIKAPYSSPAGTAFEAGLMKEEQNIRLRTVNESYDLGLSEALNMLLVNISQYGPTKYGEFLMSESGKIKDFKPYEISIPNKKIVETKDGVMLEESAGEASFFSMTDGMIDGEGMKMTITTPSNQSTLGIIEKEGFTTTLNQAIQIKNIFPDANIGNQEQRVQRREIVNGFDVDHQVVQSKEQKLRKEQADMMDAVQAIGNDLPSNLPNEAINGQNAEQNTGANTGTGAIEQTQGSPEQIPGGGIF